MATGNLWRDRHAATIDPDRFRGHDQYLEQASHYPYADMVEYVRSVGRYDRIKYMGEDGAFGCVTSRVDGMTVSRDLLDSIAEISWLESIGIHPHVISVLDIGAGYGRFAHRLVQAWHYVHVVCTDAIPESIAACKRYLWWRTGKERRDPWYIVAKPEELQLVPVDYDLAVNIHSWSECTLEEVRGWLDVLDRHKVPRLFHIPHDSRLGTWGGQGPDGPSYWPDLLEHGWQLRHVAGVGPASWPRTFQLWEKS